MKLSELYTELKLSGLSQYSAGLDQAKNANVQVSSAMDAAAGRGRNMQGVLRGMIFMFSSELPSGVGRTILALNSMGYALDSAGVKAGGLLSKLRGLSIPGMIGAAVGYLGAQTYVGIEGDTLDPSSRGFLKAKGEQSWLGGIKRWAYNRLREGAEFYVGDHTTEEGTLAGRGKYTAEEATRSAFREQRTKELDLQNKRAITAEALELDIAHAKEKGGGLAEKFATLEIEKKQELLRLGREGLLTTTNAGLIEQKYHGLRMAAEDEYGKKLKENHEEFLRHQLERMRKKEQEREQDEKAARSIRGQMFGMAGTGMNFAQQEKFSLAGFMASIEDMGPAAAGAAADKFALESLFRRKATEENRLNDIIAMRPKKVAGGVSSLEAFAQAIQSAAATTEPGKTDWEKRVVTALEDMNKTEKLIADFLKGLLPGVQLTEGDF